MPSDLPSLLSDTAGVRSLSIPLSVEVEDEFVSLVGSAEDVSIGVLDPSAPFPGDQIDAEVSE